MVLPPEIAGLVTQAASAASLTVPQFLALVAGVVEVAGGLMIAANFGTRIAAIALILFTAAVTFYFHDFWNMTDPERSANMVQAIKNSRWPAGSWFCSRSARRVRSPADMMPPSRSVFEKSPEAWGGETGHGRRSEPDGADRRRTHRADINVRMRGEMGIFDSLVRTMASGMDDCAYYTLDQCRATVSGEGGTCGSTRIYTPRETVTRRAPAKMKRAALRPPKFGTPRGRNLCGVGPKTLPAPRDRIEIVI